MKLRVIAVGGLKKEYARTGCELFLGRLQRLSPCEVIEVSDAKRGRSGDVRRWRLEEAERIRRALQGTRRWVALDERGRGWRSDELAAFIGRERDAGQAMLSFVIGGPDGLDPALRDEATWRWSLGPGTLPHELARLVLFEQLYRSEAIIKGHPYHRA